MEEKKFYICRFCGNLVGVIDDAGITPMCCGEKMTLLVPNKTDASQEKHVPSVIREGCTLKVNVGSVAHPMTDEHYIAWIMVTGGKLTQRMALSPNDKPYAEFCVGSNPVTVYAYCNLHGLWSAEA